MRKRVVFFVFVAVFCWAGLTSAANQDAAMVVDLQGGKAVFESGDKKGQEVMLMDFLVQDEQLRLEDGVTIVLNYFASGSREKISGPGVIVVGLQSSRKIGQVQISANKVDYIPPQSVVGGRDAQHLGVVVFRDVDLTGKKIVMPLTMNNTAVRNTIFIFEWQAFKDADKYKIFLYDDQDQPVDQGVTTKTSINYNEPKLVRGREYKWKLQALAGENVLSEGGGRFFLLPMSSLSQLAHTESYIKNHYPGDSTEAKIAKAMVYKKYQLNDDARQILVELKKDNPGNKNITQQLVSLNGNYNPGTK
ncbi:MAG: hypothetical protein V1742_01135 [Pseudomonadota bacterium]